MHRTKARPLGIISLFCLIFSVLFSGGCAVRKSGISEQPYAEGQLVLPGGEAAGEDDFFKLAAAADYILLGERHDNALDHQVQARLLECLAMSGKRPLLGLEMLPRKRYDGVLAAFSSGKSGIDELPAALDWKDTWGFDFNLYKPVFAVAGRHGVPVYGLNISGDLRKSVSRKGLAGLSLAEKRELPRMIIPPMPEQRDELAGFFKKHHAMLSAAKAGAATRAMPGVKPVPLSQGTDRVSAVPAGGMPKRAGMQAAFERFLLIQSLWDSSMAETAAGIRRKAGGVRPVVILAGGGHVEHGYGIASRIKVFDPAARSLLVMPFSGARPEAGAADLYFYSPVRETDFIPGPASTATAKGRGRLGLTLEPIGGKLRVLAVVPNSRAARAGILPGDILERAGSLRVASASDLHEAALKAKRENRLLSIGLQRQGAFLAFYIPETQEGELERLGPLSK